MRSISILGIFVFNLILSPFAWSQNQCVHLFNYFQHNEMALLTGPQKETPKIETNESPEIIRVALKAESDKVQIVERQGDLQKTSKLYFKKGQFNKDPKLGALELLKLVVQNSSHILEDKNVLNKDKLTLGVPLKNGYSLEVVYASDARAYSRFIIDKVSVVLPNGKSQKITDTVLTAEGDQFDKKSVEIKGALENALDIELNLPTHIEGPTLMQFADYARYFEFYTKEELRERVQTLTPKRMEYSFKYRHLKDVFTKLIIKEPFKQIFTVITTLAITSGGFLTYTDIATTPAVVTKPPTEIMIINPNLHELPLNVKSPEVKTQFAELKAEAMFKLASKTQDELTKMPEVKIDYNYLFSNEASVWIQRVKDPATKSNKVYVVFGEQKRTVQGSSLQYFIIDVDPVKYNLLIRYLESQGKVF